MGLACKKPISIARDFHHKQNHKNGDEERFHLSQSRGSIRYHDIDFSCNQIHVPNNHNGNP